MAATPPLIPSQRYPRQPESGAYYAAQPQDDLTLAGFAGILRRHWILVTSCLVATVALVGAYTLLSTPVYEAGSVLQFETEQVNVPQLVQQLETENRIGTAIEVLQGRGLAVGVVDSLGLRARVRIPWRDRLAAIFGPRRASATQLVRVLGIAPGVDSASLLVRADSRGRFTVQPAAAGGKPVTAGIGDTVQVAGVTLVVEKAALGAHEVQIRVLSLDDAVRTFESALKVSRPARDADLIAVRVRSADPAQAAAAANLLAARFIAGRQQVRTASTGGTVVFLQQQLDSLGAQLQTAEEELRDYRQMAGVVDVEEQARTQVGRLAQIQADRGAVQAERGALAALLRQIRSDTGSAGPNTDAPSSRLISFPTLFRNQAASELLGALAQVQNQRSALLTRRTAADPDVQVLTNRVHELDAQLRSIAETYLQGLTNQVASLNYVARRFGRALDSLPEKEVQAARLQREVQVRQELYTLVQTRLKEAQITQAMVDPSVHIVDAAALPDRPVRPKAPLNLALSLVLGSLLGIGASLGRELTDRSVRSRADALQIAGLPVIGAIPRIRRRVPALPGAAWRLMPSAGEMSQGGRRLLLAQQPVKTRAWRRAHKGGPLVTLPEAPAAYAESFNQLHANLALGYQDRPLKTVVFTSSVPGEGKTMSAVNFALALASRGVRVLLIDGDLRCGRVNEVFGCPRQPGFAELLSGRATFDGVARSVSVGDGTVLVIVPAGDLSPTPGRLLSIEAVREVLGTVAPQFDVVLIDSPPVNLLADASLLGSAADAVLLVVRAGHTRTEALRYAMDQLTAARAPVIGTVLNDVDPRRHSGYDGSYRYLSDVERYYQSGNGSGGNGR